MIFRTVIALAITIILYSPVATGHEPNGKVDCDETKQKIRLIQAKMRSGYTRAQGEKLEARLRILRAKRKKFCR